MTTLVTMKLMMMTAMKIIKMNVYFRLKAISVLLLLKNPIVTA